MIELPPNVRICNRDYRLRYFHDDEAESEGADGLIHYRSGLIRIQSLQDNTSILETVLHEVAHAINQVANVNSDETTEEELVTRTTPIWMCVWRDNPDLLGLVNQYAQGEL